jgi:hypothetical protein
MRRFDSAIAGLAARQDGIARAAQRPHLARVARFADDRPVVAVPPRLADAPGSSGGPRLPSRRVPPSATASSDCTALVRHSSDVVAVVDGSSQVRWLALFGARRAGL